MELISVVWTNKAERLSAETASYGSQLVVFPEAFIGGYARGSKFGMTIGNRTAKGKEEFQKYIFFLFCFFSEPNVWNIEDSFIHCKVDIRKEMKHCKEKKNVKKQEDNAEMLSS